MSKTVTIRGDRHRREHVTRRADRTWRAKVGYDEAEAIERARGLSRQEGIPYGAYQCGSCDLWHVGRSGAEPNRRYREVTDIALMVELGARVCAHLSWENSRKAKARGKYRRLLGWRAA